MTTPHQPPQSIAGHELTGETLYTKDFYAWGQQQLRLLDEGRTAELDFDGLRKEVLEFGLSVRYLLERYLTALTRTLLALHASGRLRGQLRPFRLLLARGPGAPEAPGRPGRRPRA